MKRTIWLAMLLMTTAGPAFGVSTSTWTQTNQDDFKKGTLDNTVATNLGDVKLSRAIKTLLEQDPRVSSVNALAEGPDGTIYAGTGPQGVLLAIKDGKVSTVASLDGDTNLTALLIDKSGRLLIGTSGARGQVLAIEKPGDKPHRLFTAEGVQYVWQIVETSDGNLYAGTGPTGKLYEIHPDGSNKVLLDSGENNVLSLATDGGDLLYAGTDPHGLVYKINRKTGDSFVLYNAPESEIGSLALDKDGTLYAATSEAREPTGPASTPNENQPQGRPEGGETGVPIPSKSPKQPQPPELPNPNPGEPNPIPKHPHETSMGQPSVGVNLVFALRRGEPRIRPALDTTFASTNTDHHVYLMADVTPDVAASGLKRRPPQGQPNPGNPNPIPGPGKPQPPNPPGAPEPEQNAAPQPNRQPPVNTANTGEPRPEGNAVYRIDRDGVVTEVFRQQVLVLAMVEHNGTLLIATGNEGEIYQVNPAADETVVLAKVDPKMVTCMLPASDGNIYLGMADVGSIAVMSSGYAKQGTYTSPVFDATQISRFGKIHLHGTLPAGTTLTLASRSGNVKDPDEKGWSNWSHEVSAEEYLPISAPNARFMQYRLTFTTKEGDVTPVVDDVSIAYQMPNLPPQVKSIRVGPSGDNGAGGGQPAGGNGPGTPSNGTPDNSLARVQASPKQIIAWEASDPNNDALQYSLYFRRLPHEPWILLKDKLTDPQFEWDTRTVADGRYEIKVVASDANANPRGEGKTASRVTDPFTVDNTPPVFGDLKTAQAGERIQLDFKVWDQTSTIGACDYSIDSDRDWQMVLPVDKIFDSPEETMSFATPGLKPGQHQITLRATDSKGNVAFHTVVVTVKEPVAQK